MVGGLAAYQAEVPDCDDVQCDLELSPGSGRRILGDVDLAVQDVMVRERAADSAVITIDGDRREVTSGTTQQIGGLRVTLISVEHDRVHLLVTSVDG
ncbi:MAG TPA: hypothetical protein VKZ67_12840 [Natronosporangium sp.]|nr:hypothetical protein [Natronosporangium sp.]